MLFCSFFLKTKISVEKKRIIVTLLGSAAASSIFLVIVMLELKDQASYAMPF